MSERERPLDELLQEVRAQYNAPPAEVPREEMWAAVRVRIEAGGEADPTPVEEAPGAVVTLPLRRSRRARALRRWTGLVAAAAGLLALGVGLGRMSAPSDGVSGPTAVADAEAEEERGAPLRTAAVEHLRGTEALLTALRTDARRGELDPDLRALAHGMLSRTRLFLDASRGEDPVLRGLMEDLELVLAQIVAVTDDGADVDGPRTRTELDLALRGLDDRDVLTRIRSLSGPGLAGT